MAHPLDEYPIHQVPLSMAHPGTSDRDFYDRNIFHVIPHGQLDMQMICGYGVYPNLGVKDAYACVRVGTQQHVMRASDAMDDDRLRMECGPFRIEVIEPLRDIRVVCEGGPGEVAMDLRWRPSVPVVDEPAHVMRKGKVILDASRFCGIGFWEGTLSAGGETWEITPADFSATRDRSWGIRPVGEAPPPGRFAAEHPPSLHWFWIPLRFEHYSLMFILQEFADGERILNNACRMWPDGRVEQLGWPEVDVTYRSGSRHPLSAVVHAASRGRKPLDVEIEVLGSMPLNVGCGYGADPDWGHGQWKGRDWCERVVYDLTDPAVAARVPFTVTDHVARARCGDDIGHGIFEHGSIGVHEPSGFTDFFSVAP
jgi:hypothetical protein